jgi:hypothetical protein
MVPWGMFASTAGVESQCGTRAHEQQNLRETAIKTLSQSRGRFQVGAVQWSLAPPMGPIKGAVRIFVT